MVKTSQFYYGNLQSYKLFIRPEALKRYKTANDKKLSKHQKTVQMLLRNLALNGSMTTWEIAKKIHKNNLDKVRTREKEIRRIFLGRIDKGKHSQGIFELGLLEQEEKIYRNRPIASYRLSPHGILFCIDALEFGDKEIDTIASMYANIFPKVFGRWSYLKKIIRDDVYKMIRILSKGMTMDNPQFSKIHSNPLYELMSFLTIYYKKNLEYITEDNLVEEISYWFYIYFLYSSKTNNHGIKKLKKVFKNDKETKEWFSEFVVLAKQYYTKRRDNLTIFFNDFKQVS